MLYDPKWQEAPAKTKEQDVRERWIKALREQGHRQCRKATRRGSQVCALGLLVEVAGETLETIKYPSLGLLAGLCVAQTTQIVRLNDGWPGWPGPFKPHTFAEIADIIEGWFK